MLFQTKQSLGARRNTKKRDMVPRSASQDTDEFVLASKTKNSKKLRAELGGNVMQPSSLELPYKLEGDSPRPSKSETQHSSRRHQKSRNKKNKSESLPPVGFVCMPLVLFKVCC